MTTLHPSWTKALAALPETGMGYQVLELREVTRRPQHVIVVNGSEAIERAHGGLAVQEGLEEEAADRIVSILEGHAEKASYRVLSRRQAVNAMIIETKTQVLGSGPASEASTVQSESEERFLRFSASPNDVRILPDGSVTSGTYVTTLVDGMTHVKSGADAVRRYALPNPAPAVHRYYLDPPQPIDIKRGHAQPAYGQPGGGAEVIFVTGSPAGTKSNQDRIPPS